MPANKANVTLTCTKDDCGCRLLIEVPCPHGDTYTCACGHLMEPIAVPQGLLH